MLAENSAFQVLMNGRFVGDLSIFIFDTPGHWARLHSWLLLDAFASTFKVLALLCGGLWALGQSRWLVRDCGWAKSLDRTKTGHDSIGCKTLSFKILKHLDDNNLADCRPTSGNHTIHRANIRIKRTTIGTACLSRHTEVRELFRLA